MQFDFLKTSSWSVLPSPARDLFDFKVSNYRDGLVTLTVDLPAPMLNAFVGLLDSLCDSFRFLQHKTKILKAQAVVANTFEAAKREKMNDDYKAVVLEAFDLFVAGGNSFRESIKKTRDYLNKYKGFALINYDIELIARAAGRLSKRKNK